GFGRDGNGGSAGQPLLSVEGGRGDVHGLDGFHRGHIKRVVRQPEIDVDRAIYARIVVIAVRAVDVKRKRARRRIVDGVLELRGGRPRHEIDEALVVAIAGQRKVGHGGGRQFGTDVGLVRLQNGRRGRDRHLLGKRADFQLEVNARDGVDGDVDAFPDYGPKTAGSNLQIVARS